MKMKVDYGITPNFKDEIQISRQIPEASSNFLNDMKDIRLYAIRCVYIIIYIYEFYILCSVDC